MVGHSELGPEDVACSARITSMDTIEYVASPLFAAMFGGGIFFFDEIAKAPPAALNPLAAVLDERRTLTSVLAGIHVKAHPEFLFCAALNEDEELGGQLPQFIQERLIPAIHVGILAGDELAKILRSHLRMLDEKWVDVYMSEFWRQGEISPRDAKKQLQFAYGLAAAAGLPRASRQEIREYLRRAGDKECEARSAQETQGEVEPAPSPQEKEKIDEQFIPFFPKRRRNKTTH